jgi:hypothetical protein
MSSNPHLDFEVRRTKAIRERVLIEDPDIDEQTLADTTEGLTDLHELLAAIVRGALEDEANIAKLKSQIMEKTTRLDRFQIRAEQRRELVRDVMIETDVKKLQMPDFTASLRAGQPHVVVVDENLIPQTFWEQRPHLRKRELLDAMKDGAQIEGAALSNPGMSLSVRTR